MAAVLGTATPVAQAATGTPCMPTGAETVATDQAAYSPGSLVHMTGAGYTLGCDVVVKVTRPDGSIVTGDGSNTPGSDTVSTDLFGGFSYDYQLQSVPAISGTYSVDVLGLAETVLAHTTFEDALTIKGDVIPSYIPGSNTVTFRTLVRNTSSDTAISQVNVDLPSGYTATSVAGTGFSSGTWAAATAPSGFDFAFTLTSGTALATSTGWARIDITATTPAVSTGGGATWRFQGCANVGCGGGNSTRDTDNQAFVLVDPTPPAARYTADFRDGSDNVTTPLLRNGAAATLRLRITSTAGNNTTKYTAIAFPTCFGTPSGVTLTGGSGYDPPVVRDGFIILGGGNLGSVGNFMTVQFTTTPTGCADGALAFLSSVASNQTDDASGTNQVVAISGAYPSVTMDSTAPTVTINQAAGQNDPTKTSPINFTVTFSEPVSGFTGSDVTITGTAGGTKTVVVSGGPTTYNVAVSGMTSDGTVVASIPAGAAQDAAGNNSTASSSTDNTVTYDTTGPVTSGTAVSATPTNAPPTVTATETDALSNVASAEYFIDNASCTNGTGTAMSASDGSFNSATENVTATLTAAQFNALGQGTHTIYVHGKDNVETGNWGACQSVVFVKDTVKPDVAINQASGQADPTTVSPIHFTAVFTEPVSGFASADVSITGTAGGMKTVTVTEIAPNDGTTYDVAVSGMTQRGTVIATIPAGSNSPSSSGAQDAAGNANTASTSTDNTVVWDRVPSTGVTLDDHSPRTNDVLTATATPSDPDGDSVTLTYVWKVNGTTKQTTVSASTTDTFNLASAGFGDKNDLITVTVTPNDGLFDGSSASDSATVVNSPPTVSLSGPTTANEGDTKTYTFSANDDDGDALSFAAGYPKCGSGGTLVGSPTVGGGSFQCSFPDGPESPTVAVKVKDSDNALSNEASKSVSVANVAPTVTLDAGSDLTVDEGSTHTYGYTIFDPGQDTVTAVTTSCSGTGSKLGGSDLFTNTAGSFKCSFADGPNSSLVSAAATDEDGDTGAADTQTVTVKNVAPTVTLDAGNLYSFDESSSAVRSFAYSVSDPAGSYDPITIDSSSCGAAPNSVVSNSFNAGTNQGTLKCNFPDGPDSPTISISASDGDGGSGSASHAVTVKNVAPTVTLDAGNLYSFDESSSAVRSFAYSVSDPAGSYDPITIDSSSCGAAPNSVVSNSFNAGTNQGTLKCNFPDGPDSPTISIGAGDGDGGSGSASHAVTVKNVAPTVTLDAGNLYSFDESSSAVRSFAYSVSDPGGSYDPITIDSSSCGAAPNSVVSNSFNAGTNQGTLKCNFPDGPDSPTISISAGDGDGGSGSASQAVTVKNVAPAVTLAPGNDLTVDEGSTHTYGYTIFDPGQDTVSSVTTSCSGTGSKLAGSDLFTNTAGSFKCSFADGPNSSLVSAAATDEDGDTGAADTQTVTVKNVAPTVMLAAGNDLTVDEGSTHTYGYTIFDPGQDAVTSVTTSCSGTGSKLAGSDSFTNTAGSFKCSFADGPNSSLVSAAATDEDGDTGAASTQTVMVKNVAPRVSLAGPNEANEGETKTYAYTVNDPGQDSFSVAPDYPSCGSNGDLVPGSSSTTATGGSFKCHFPDGPKQTTVAIKVVDEDGAMSVPDTEAVDIIDVTIANVAPTLTAPSDQSADEGTSKSFDLGSFSDDGVNDDPWTVAVDWGDGSSAESFPTNSQGGISHSHAYADNGSYTVKVQVTDKDGAASAQKTFEVTVANVAPKLTAPANQTADEGTGKSFDLGSFSDDGVNDAPWTVAVDWGDTSSESFTTGTQGPIARSHTYDDNGTYAVKVKVTDKDGGASEQTTFDVLVANVAPTATFNAPNAVDEGSAIQISLTGASDVSSADQAAGFTYAFNCGSGYGAFSGDNTASCPTNDNGPRTVKGKVRDKDGGEREYSKDVAVNNVPPSATFDAPGSVDEGSNINLSLTNPSDPSSVDTTVGFTYAFDCGDGAGYGAPGPSNSRSCPTSDNGTRTVKGKIRDKDGGEREYTKQVSVGNVAPQVTVTSPSFGAIYPKPATVAVTASFTDAGKNDTHTCSFSWDDGTSSAGTVTETQGSGSGTCTGSHTYTAAGVYTLKVTVTDDDGASTTVEWMVIVYDPSAGFITGGGWIDVAQGSYPAQPTLSGRANFGFNSQYKKGATVPTGETEFQFQVGSFNFHSTRYDFLVVSGYKAQYKGTGEVNGMPGYSFRLTAYDGALMNPTGSDKFRIKVVDAAGVVVFDNRVGKSDDVDLADPQVISGGSIVIHKA